MDKVLILLLFFFILSGYAGASVQANVDTIEIAKHYRNIKAFKKACALLSAYHNSHPTDANTLWLYAQTAFWRGYFRLSKKLYKEAMALQPDRDLMLIDYARSLAGMGDRKQAVKMIKEIESQGKTYPDLLLLRAQISYYEGDYRSAASQVLVAIDSNKQSATAKALYYDVLLARSPWIKASLDYTNDNQPMQTILPSVEAGLFLHQYSALQIGFYAPVFIRNKNITNAQIATVGHTASFNKAGLVIKADAGIDKFPYRNTVSWIGDVYLQQTFAKYLVFDALAERKPYLYTYTSVDTALSTGHFVSTLGWNDQNFINGKIGLDFSLFAQRNYVYSLYGYVYAPPIKFSFVQIRLGYSYSFTTSNFNDYSSTRPLDTIIKYFATAPNVNGIYAPYFTPNKQQIHSALISLSIQPLHYLEIGATGSIGFYAYTQNPYLYLNKNPDNATYIARSFAREGFVPADAGAYVQWQLAKKYSIKVAYKYHTTYYYSSHTISIGFKMSIWK